MAKVLDLIKQGREYRKTGNNQAALNCFQQAIDLSPQTPHPYYEQALQLELMHAEKAKIIQAYQKFIDLGKENSKLAPQIEKSGKKIQELQKPAAPTPPAPAAQPLASAAPRAIVKPVSPQPVARSVTQPVAYPPSSVTNIPQSAPPHIAQNPYGQSGQMPYGQPGQLPYVQPRQASPMPYTPPISQPYYPQYAQPPVLDRSDFQFGRRFLYAFSFALLSLSLQFILYMLLFGDVNFRYGVERMLRDGGTLFILALCWAIAGFITGTKLIAIRITVVYVFLTTILYAAASIQQAAPVLANSELSFLFILLLMLAPVLIGILTAIFVRDRY